MDRGWLLGRKSSGRVLDRLTITSRTKPKEVALCVKEGCSVARRAGHGRLGRADWTWMVKVGHDQPRLSMRGRHSSKSLPDRLDDSC